MIPIAIATNRPGTPITVGAGPRAIAMTPGGRAPITVGDYPVALALAN